MQLFLDSWLSNSSVLAGAPVDLATQRIPTLRVDGIDKVILGTIHPGYKNWAIRFLNNGVNRP